MIDIRPKRLAEFTWREPPWAESPIINMEPIKLIIAGAAKAGTTSLKEYLGQHPDVCTHKERGINFFEDDQEYAAGYPSFFARYFDCERSRQKVILAKSVRVLYSPKAMKRLRDHNAEVRVVISLRNPIDRAYSDYWYARRQGWEDLQTFEEAIEADLDRFGRSSRMRQRCAYLDRSLYCKHLSNLFQHFDRDQVHIVLFEEIRSNAATVAQSLFRRVPGLDPDFVPRVERRHNAAALPRSRVVARLLSPNRSTVMVKRGLRRVVPDLYRQAIRNTIVRLNEKEVSLPPMKPQTRAYLTEYFESHNAQLSGFLPLDLSHWSDTRA